MTAIISFVFPFMIESEALGGKWTFIIFAVPNILGLLFTVYLMKETSGVDVFELKRLYSDDDNSSLL